MKTTKLQTTAILFFGLSFLISSCGPAGPAPATPADADLPATATRTLLPAVTATPTEQPTEGPTPTIYPPVFNLAALADNRELASFIITLEYKRTGNGKATDSRKTIEYIKEPFGASELAVYNGNQHIDYWIGGWEYSKGGDGHWGIDLTADPSLLLDYADMRHNPGIDLLKSAQFVEQEDFHGIPANHFEFDQTDLTGYGVPGDKGYKIEKAQGDFYLALDGNYVLYFHSKVNGNLELDRDGLNYLPGTNEITKELSSINQLEEISLPADYPALEVDLGLPLPPDTGLVSLDHYTPLQGGDVYIFKTSVSNDEFLLFYKNLAPTNGWTVSQVGQMHEYCGRGCAVLAKGDAEMVLYMDDSGLSPWGITMVGYYHK